MNGYQLDEFVQFGEHYHTTFHFAFISLSVVFGTDLLLRPSLSLFSSQDIDCYVIDNNGFVLVSKQRNDVSLRTRTQNTNIAEVPFSL